MSNVEPILGRYLNITIDGVEYRLYFEEAGRGIPLLCLHTAGADGRQYRHLLNDPSITGRYRVIAFDMPYLHVRPVRAPKPGGEQAGKLVVLQPVGPRRIRGDVHF